MQHWQSSRCQYYLNEKKATELLQVAKVPMPKMPATRNGGFIHSLTEANSPVKHKWAGCPSTKSEMNRLIADAQKISNVKFQGRDC